MFPVIKHSNSNTNNIKNYSISKEDKILSEEDSISYDFNNLNLNKQNNKEIMIERIFSNTSVRNNKVNNVSNISNISNVSNANESSMIKKNRYKTISKYSISNNFDNNNSISLFTKRNVYHVQPVSYNLNSHDTSSNINENNKNNLNYKINTSTKNISNYQSYSENDNNPIIVSKAQTPNDTENNVSEKHEKTNSVKYFFSKENNTMDSLNNNIANNSNSRLYEIQTKLTNIKETVSSLDSISNVNNVSGVLNNAITTLKKNNDNNIQENSSKTKLTINGNSIKEYNNNNISNISNNNADSNKTKINTPLNKITTILESNQIQTFNTFDTQKTQFNHISDSNKLIKTISNYNNIDNNIANINSSLTNNNCNTNNNNKNKTFNAINVKNSNQSLVKSFQSEQESTDKLNNINNNEEISFKHDNFRGVKFTTNYNNIGSEQKLNLIIGNDNLNEDYSGFSSSYENNRDEELIARNPILTIIESTVCIADSSIPSNDNLNKKSNKNEINDIDSKLFLGHDIIINAEGLVKKVQRKMSHTYPHNNIKKGDSKNKVKSNFNKEAKENKDTKEDKKNTRNNKKEINDNKEEIEHSHQSPDSISLNINKANIFTNAKKRKNYTYFGKNISYISNTGLISQPNPSNNNKDNSNVLQHCNTRSTYKLKKPDIELNLNHISDKNLIKASNDNIFIIYFCLTTKRYIFKFLTNPTVDKSLFYLKLQHNKNYYLDKTIILHIGNCLFKIIPGLTGRSNKQYSESNEQVESENDRFIKLGLESRVLASSFSSNISNNQLNNNNNANFTNCYNNNEYCEDNNQKDSYYNKNNYSINNTNTKKNPKVRFENQSKKDLLVNYEISIIKYDKDPSNNKLFKFNSTTKSNITIGRSSDNDIIIKNSFISKYHIRIIFDNDACKWALIDGCSSKPSSQGSWVILNSKIQIDNNTEIKFNNHVLKFILSKEYF